MSLKPLISHTLGISDMVMDKYLSDLKPESFLIRPVAGMNHLAWQVGHLISVERRTMESIRPGSSPELPEGFDAKHAMDKHDDDIVTDFLTKDEYLKLWQTQRAASKSLLEMMSDDELAAPCPNEKMRGMCPSVASMFSLVGMHSLMHAGQFVAVRRQEAMPIAF